MQFEGLGRHEVFVPGKRSPEGNRPLQHDEVAGRAA